MQRGFNFIQRVSTAPGLALGDVRGLQWVTGAGGQSPLEWDQCPHKRDLSEPSFPFLHVRTSVSVPRCGLGPDIKPVDTCVLDFPASRTGK